MPSQGGDLPAQVGCGLLDPPGPVPGGLDEGVLDGVVDAGAEDVLEEVLALGGVGAQEPGELALRQDDRLRELFPTEPDGARDLRVGVAHAGDGLVERFPTDLGQVPELDGAVLGGGALAAPLGPLVGGGAAHPVDAGAGGEDELDDALGVRAHEGGADALLGGVGRVGHVPVEGEDDRVDDGGLARAGGAGEQEAARGAHRVEVDVLPPRVGAYAGHGQGVDPHRSLLVLARADS